MSGMNGYEFYPTQQHHQMVPTPRPDYSNHRSEIDELKLRLLILEKQMSDEVNESNRLLKESNELLINQSMVLIMLHNKLLELNLLQDDGK